MRFSLGCFLAACALPLSAQDNNRVYRNNLNWLWVSSVKHTNQNAYLPTTITPAAFTAATTTGVPAGTHSWRWLPNAQNQRKEPRQVTGYEYSIRPSAASATFPGTYYLWEMKLHPTKARTGGGMDPDLAAMPLHMLARTTTTIATFGNYSGTRTLSAPVPLTFNDVAMSLRWEGGEHQDVPGTQSHWGSSRESQYNPITWGFSDPTNVIVYGAAQNTFPRFSYMEEQAVLCAQSDWGQERLVTRTPPLFGYGLGTGQADMASMASQLAWDVYGGMSMSGKTAVPLFNFGPVFPIGVPFLGVVLEVNPADPLLGVLASAGYIITLDATGFGDGPYLPIPVLGPGAIGATFGCEFVLVDTTSGQLVDSTQSSWTTITR